jgi:hypothetical protein
LSTDQDESGALTAENIQSLGKRMGRDLSAEQAAAFITQADKDGSGKPISQHPLPASHQSVCHNFNVCLRPKLGGRPIFGSTVAYVHLLDDAICHLYIEIMPCVHAWMQ